jgi:hypothetical protein
MTSKIQIDFADKLGLSAAMRKSFGINLPASASQPFGWMPAILRVFSKAFLLFNNLFWERKKIF